MQEREELLKILIDIHSYFYLGKKHFFLEQTAKKEKNSLF